MKKIFLKYLAIGLALFLPSACTDFLNEKNPNQLSTDSFWNTLDDCDAGLTAVYNSFKNGSLMATADESNRSDLTYPGYGRPNTTNAYYNMTFTDASPTPNSKWDALYKGIFRANQVIQGINKLTFPTADQQLRSVKILSQARFFRGLFYFYLYNSFNEGSVIIYDFVPQNESEFYKSVSPATEVQKFFLNDLEFAYANLPSKWTGVNDKGRATAGAAASVLGQNYLYAKDYTKAIIYFKDVITNPEYNYSLTENIGDNFTTKNEQNQESILEVNYSVNYKANTNAYAEDQVSNTLAFNLSPVGGWRGAIPSCWLIMAYKNEVMDVNDARNYVADATAPGAKRLRKYSLRTSYSIALPDDPDLSYYLKTCAQSGPFSNAETSYFRKYTNWDIVTNEKDIVPNIRSGINYRVIRLADVYLMYAECLIKGGSDNDGVVEAMKYINKVRQRSALQLIGLSGTGDYPIAGHDGFVYNATTLMNHLMYVERPLELSIEGHAIRMIDMRRWGITKARFTELSQKKYYGINYVTVDVLGKPLTKWSAVLIEGVLAGKTVITDYQQAAANYNEKAHAYWPLPNSETIANPVLTK